MSLLNIFIVFDLFFIKLIYSKRHYLFKWIKKQWVILIDIYSKRHYLFKCIKKKQWVILIIVFLSSMILFYFYPDFWLNKKEEYLIDPSWLQNIILAIVAFFVPFVIAAYQNIFSITKEKNKIHTEEDEQKIQNLDKLVLVNTVLQPNFTFLLTIFSVVFLSLIPFLVDKFGNIIYSFVPIVLLICIFKFWNIFQDLLGFFEFFENKKFNYQLKFLKSLNFSNDQEKNKQIADKMEWAWKEVWAKSSIINVQETERGGISLSYKTEDQALIPIFITHLQEILALEKRFYQEAIFYFYYRSIIENLTTYFIQNIDKRNPLYVGSFFDKLLESISYESKDNSCQIQILGNTYHFDFDQNGEILKKENVRTGNIRIQFNFVVEKLLIPLIDYSYKKLGSHIQDAFCKNIWNLFPQDQKMAKVLGQGYFRQIIQRIFFCELENDREFTILFHLKKEKEKEQILQQCFLLWLDDQPKIAEKLFSNDKKKYTIIDTLFPKCDHHLFYFLGFHFYLLKENKFTFQSPLSKKTEKTLNYNFGYFFTFDIVVTTAGDQNLNSAFSEQEREKKNNSFRYIKELFPFIYKSYNFLYNDPLNQEEIEKIIAQNKSNENKWLELINCKFKEIKNILESQEIIAYCKADPTKENNRKNFLQVFSHQWEEENS